MHPFLSLAPRVALLFCASLASALATAPARAETVWKLASGYASTSFQTLNLLQFSKDVATATGGSLRIEVHPNNTLVKLAEIPARVQAGDIAAGEVILSGMAKQIPVAGADSVPFLVNSFDDARRLWQHQRPVIDRSLQERGLIGLYAVPWPSQGLYSVRPVSATSDLKGTKMRTYNAATVRIAELLGALPIDVTTADLAQALAEGRIDSMITSSLTGVDSKVWSQLKYFYDIRAWYPKNVVLVNRAAFDALDAKTRSAVRTAAATAEQRGWRMSQEAAETSTATLASHGMRIETVGFALRSELRRLGERFSIEWVRGTGREASAILIPYYTVPPTP